MYKLLFVLILGLYTKGLLCQRSQPKHLSPHVLSRHRSETVVDESASGAAKEGLRILQRSITVENYKQFGFTSLQEAARATVGDGVPLYYVRADQLKAYTPGVDAGTLMIPTYRRLFPIIVDGIGKLVMTLEFKAGHWQLVDFGEQEIASSLSRLKEHSTRQKSGPGSAQQNYFAVQIPAMHLSFLAFSPPQGPGGGLEDKRQVTLTPLSSTENMKHSIGFTNSEFLVSNPHFTDLLGGTKSANDVFAAIAPNAGSAMQINAPH
jgi:hypothetical protein